MWPTTSEVYLHVTDNVLDNFIRNFRAELLSQGINGTILDKLQELWVLKMEKSGVVQRPTFQEPLPVLGPDEMAQLDAVCEPSFIAAYYKSLSESQDAADTQTERIAPDMQQPSPLISKTPLRLDVNVAYEEERGKCGVEVIPKTESAAKDNLPKDFVPRQDKCADVYYSLSAQEFDGEAPLNESDDVEMDDEDESTSSLVLAKYEKVSKKKNRWKCLFTDGIMHLNDREILFSKATGEFEF